MKLGLAMSGGGIKGAAHIGVIQALQEENIKVDIVGGTSIGSIVAALYAMEYTPKEMLKLFNYFSKLIFKNSAMYTDPRGKKLLSIQAGGLYSGENIAFAIEEAGKYKNIKKLQDLKIPIVIPAVDLRDSEKYVFTNMGKINDKYLNKADISIAVRASSSYPAIFAPCIYNKHKFVDGGILDNIPVEEVKKIGADKVIAVRFKLNKTSRTIGLRSTLNKAIDIMFSKIEGEEVKKADYVIEIDTQDVNPFDFKQSNKCYKYGYLQTKKEIANIKKMIYKED
ncbi:MAG: patatin-like phospholipase family protein [Clostridia bacterium]|jgi:NTE family protein